MIFRKKGNIKEMINNTALLVTPDNQFLFNKS